MVMVRNIFMYMDRTYIPQHRHRPVYNLGLWLFWRVVWERDKDDCLKDNGNNNVDGDDKDNAAIGEGDQGSSQMRSGSCICCHCHCQIQTLSSLGPWHLAPCCVLCTRINSIVSRMPHSAWPSSRT
jgi:hypothetical protein